MNTDKAYIFGLIIGGGIWGNAEDVFRIHLPYNKWGSYQENPARAGQISGDILKTVGQTFRAVYGISVQYEATNSGNWTILCDGDMTALKADLLSYGIECEGELRQNTSISLLVADLVDDNLKRRFIAGLVDTIGSMAVSQRRFSDEIQIMSFEIKGFNFSFVCDLCRMLHSVNCYPDQILWNHPNLNASSNPYYSDWDKGNKLRIQLDQYANFGAFAFRAKAQSSQENRRLQNQAHPGKSCPDQTVRISKKCVHSSENDSRLPENIRGGHYIHYRHICAVLGCEHAPYGALQSLFSHLGRQITPFPILLKDTLSEVERIVDETFLYSNRQYQTLNVSVSGLLSEYKSSKSAYLYGTTNGYPLAEVLQAVAYVIADDSELFGNRPRGGYEVLVERHIALNPSLVIEIRKPDLLTPLVIVGNGRGAMVGADNPTVYSRLINVSPDNEYKLCVRPITEEDLQ